MKKLLFRFLISFGWIGGLFGVVSQMVSTNEKGEGGMDVHIPVEVIQFANWLMAQGVGTWVLGYVVVAYVGWFTLAPKTLAALNKAHKEDGIGRDTAQIAMIFGSLFAPLAGPIALCYLRAIKHQPKEQKT